MEQTLSGVGVLDKSIGILDAVAESPGPRTLGDLVEATGLPKATAHRLAAALEAHGLLRRIVTGALSVRLIGLGRRDGGGRRPPLSGAP